MANARLPSTPIGPPSERIDLLERFDRAWRDTTTPRIDDFLPPLPREGGAGEGGSHREQLEDLIKIDLEYRWRLAYHERAGLPAPGSAGHRRRPDPDPLPECPLLEDYLAHFPELGPPERLAPALIGEEYRVRWRWGDCPGRADYLTRFAGQGAVLGPILAAIDAELEADGDLRTTVAGAPVALPAENARPPFETRRAVRAGRDPGHGLVRLGLACPRPGARPRRGDQAAARGISRRPHAGAAVPPRGPVRGLAPPPGHRRRP